MKKIRERVRARVAKRTNQPNFWTWRTDFSPVMKVAAVAVLLVIGYGAGFYHQRIEAAMGPIFGYQAHTGSIDLSTLEETFSKLSANYDGKLDTSALIKGANKGMVDAVDDAYTVYMSASESNAFNDALAGKIGAGVGAEIGERNDKVTVIRVIKDNPAIEAGVMAGDIITKINDQSTAGWDVNRAVSQIRGEENTTVKLTILRGTETKEFTITRKIINNPSVYSSITEDNVGIMTITRFDEETGDLARTAAEEFVSKGVKKVVLDLRDNGGGYVDAAREVASVWLNDKIVVTERSGGKVRETIKSGNNALLDGIETIVLVNNGSASASEIVAGALQDYGAAKLVGEKTFGKGSVQKLVTLSNGATLKVTIAKWYTPDGKNINKDGIKPDYSVGLTQENLNAGVDPQLDKAKEILNQ